jgi:hypothetical protein
VAYDSHLRSVFRCSSSSALAAFGAKGNAAKGLKIASEIKMPPLGGKPALAMAGGGKLEVEPQKPVLENINESRGSGGNSFSNTAILAFKSYRGVLERMFPSKIPTGIPKDIASKVMKIRNDANAIIDTSEKLIQQNPKQETALLELLRTKLRDYFRKVDTEHGRIRLNDNEVIYHTRDEAVTAAKARAGIPENAKPVDAWEVGGDQKAANIAKANLVGQNDGAEYVAKSDSGGWGRYEVYEVKINGEKLIRGIVDHTDDPNNPLAHVHAADFGKLPLSKAELRAANYEAVGKIKHHLAYQVAK